MMKLIKESIDGRTIYRKARKAEYEKNPELKYKPSRSFSNSWYFANTGRNICDMIWEIGQEYYFRLQDSKTRPKRINKHPVQLIKYFYLLYLCGGRRNELLEKPYPELEVANTNDGVYVLVHKLNEKHLTPQGTKDVIVQALPVMCKAEQNMWNFVTDGGMTTRVQDILRLDLWNKGHRTNVSHLVKVNFHTNLKDQDGVVHRNAGITPHILRHMRTFNVLVNHKVPPPLVIKWFGWNSERMLYYYAYIQKMLSQANQMQMLKNYNLLTNLRIEASKTFA